MQNHYVISSKYHFWTRNVPNWTKTLTSVMSRPAKTCPGGQVLVSKADFCFYYFRNYTFPFFIINLMILVEITWFLSFSGKNDAESLCHFVKIPFLDPKRAKLDKNSDFRHVRTYSWLHKLRNTQGKIHGWQWNISRKYIWNI